VQAEGMTTTQIRPDGRLSPVVARIRTALASHAGWAGTAQLVTDRRRRHLPTPGRADRHAAPRRAGWLRSHTLQVEPDGIVLDRRSGLAAWRGTSTACTDRRHDRDLDPRRRHVRHAHRLQRPAPLRLMLDRDRRRSKVTTTCDSLDNGTRLTTSRAGPCASRSTWSAKTNAVTNLRFRTPTRTDPDHRRSTSHVTRPRPKLLHLARRLRHR
jgi:hypothetical protein